MTIQMVNTMRAREMAIWPQGWGADNMPMRGTMTRGAVGGKSEAATPQGELGLLSRKGRMAKLVHVGMTARVMYIWRSCAVSQVAARPEKRARKGRNPGRRKQEKGSAQKG